MQVTQGQIHDAVFALNQIIGRPRAIPTTGKFRIAKLRDALLPFYEPIEKQRGDLVEKHGSEQFADEAKTKSAGWTIQPDTPAMKAYLDEWNAVRAKEVLLPKGVNPLTLTSLGDDTKGVEAAEFVLLGPFVEE